MRVVSVSGEMPGVFAFGDQATGILAVGQQATGVFAFGQLATGVVAIGQLATGVVAVGQLARGGFVAGQLCLGLACAGQLAAGVLWCAGIGVGGTAGPGLVLGLFRKLNRRRLIAWVRREPWDTVRLPAWRRAVGVAGLAGLGAAWWFVAGQPLIAALS
jgi:hypothetical protein